jgi:SlyX protein
VGSWRESQNGVWIARGKYRSFDAVAGSPGGPPSVQSGLQNRGSGARMEERINHLESKLCLAEDLLDELNRTVFRQQEQLDQLQAQIRLLYQQMQGGGAGGGAEKRDPREEIPPHY